MKSNKGKEMSNINQEEYTVICSDCLSTQNLEQVMKSVWYQSGNTPPCQFCGGVTHEMPVSNVEKFIKDTRAGKRVI